MAERHIVELVSDLSGQVMPEAEAFRAHVDSHPGLPESPTVRLDVNAEEAEQLRRLAAPAVRVVLHGPGEDILGEVLSVPVAKFETLFKGLGRKAVEVLAEAPVVGKKTNHSNGETGRD